MTETAPGGSLSKDSCNSFSITGFTSPAQAAGECLAERSRLSRCVIPCEGCLNSLVIARGPTAVVQYLSAGTIASRAEIVSAG